MSDYLYYVTLHFSDEPEPVSLAEDEMEQVLLDGLDRLGRYADRISSVSVEYVGEQF